MWQKAQIFSRRGIVESVPGGACISLKWTLSLSALEFNLFFSCCSPYGSIFRFGCLAPRAKRVIGSWDRAKKWISRGSSLHAKSTLSLSDVDDVGRTQSVCDVHWEIVPIWRDIPKVSGSGRKSGITNEMNFLPDDMRLVMAGRGAACDGLSWKSRVFPRHSVNSTLNFKSNWIRDLVADYAIVTRITFSARKTRRID